MKRRCCIAMLMTFMYLYYSMWFSTNLPQLLNW
nr:MAG TPA: hypothetical protein [Caudoviricetes sp.]